MVVTMVSVHKIKIKQDKKNSLIEKQYFKVSARIKKTTVIVVVSRRFVFSSTNPRLSDSCLKADSS